MPIVEEQAEVEQAETQAKADAKARERAEKQAEKTQERPKQVPLTLSQRKHLLKLAKAGAKGAYAKGQQAIKPYEHFVANGLAESLGVDEDKGTKYRVTNAGKTRAKQVNPKYAG